MISCETIKIEKKCRENANAPKKIFKPIMGGARWMIFFRSLTCDVVTTNLLRDTDYGHTKAKSLCNSLRPKFKSQSQINIWDVDIEA